MGLELGAALLYAGTAASIGGTAYSAYSGQKAATASKKAEKLRQRQMNLDSAMKRREILRKTQLARAQAVSRTTAAGVSDPGGSALGGATASITQRGQEDLGYNQFSTDIGNDLFSANRQYTQWSSNAQTGSGIAQMGMNLIQAAPTLQRIGTEIAGQRSNSQVRTAPGYRGPYISSIY